MLTFYASHPRLACCLYKDGGSSVSTLEELSKVYSREAQKVGHYPIGTSSMEHHARKSATAA